jgi:hypothetical protein
MGLIRTGIAFWVVLLLLGTSAQCLLLSCSTAHPTQASSTESFDSTSSDNTTDYYAVICACSQYENPKYNLPRTSPAPDSKLLVLYDALLQTNNWEEDHILLLLNQNATKQNITHALETMSGLVGPNDVFLFTWNGHGSEVPDSNGDEAQWDPSDTYDEVICPYDIHKTNGTFSNAITDDELEYFFSKIHGKGKCLIFESCLSGALVDQQTSDTEGRESTYFKTDFLRDITHPGVMDVNANNTIVMMSTRPDTLGRATYLTHSPFLYSAARTITHGKKYDKNNDGFLSAEEVFRIARPLTFIQSSFLWVPVWISEYLVYKFDLYKLFSFLPGLIKSYRFLDSIVPMPIVLATGIMVFVYLIVQLLVKYLTGHFVLNWPNIQDDYPSELPLVQL